MSSPNDLLLLLGQVSSEACDAFGEQPDAPVRDFDMRENVCGRKLVYVTLRGLAGVRGECGDINQPSNSVICSRGRDDGSAVRVADENRGAANAPQRAFTVATSLSFVSRPYWADVTSYPSA